MTATLHPMDEHPPDAIGEWLNGVSVNVTLHYYDGREVRGFHDPWYGWSRWQDNGMPTPCDDDAEMPVSWSDLEVK